MDVTEPGQTDAPLVEALLAYRAWRTAAFHTPGHKLGAGAPADLVEALGERLLAAHTGIANGLADTQESGGLLCRAEELAAQAWGPNARTLCPTARAAACRLGSWRSPGPATRSSCRATPTSRCSPA